MTPEEAFQLILQSHPRRDSLPSLLGAAMVATGVPRKDVLAGLGISRAALSDAEAKLEGWNLDTWVKANEKHAEFSRENRHHKPPK